MTVPRGTLIALALLAALGFGCVDDDQKCLSDLAVTPEWCVKICEGQSFEFTLDPNFGQRCGFCSCQ